MINKNKLFDLLGVSFNQEDLSESLTENYNMDFLKIKMYIKLIESIKEFKSSINKMNGSDDKFDELAENLIFNKALFYIETVNADNIVNINDLTSLFIKRFTRSLQISIKYFEKKEQYEICAFLFNIEKTLKDIKI